MNQEVKYPVQTYRDGNKITKVCVESMHKVFNRIIDKMDHAHNKVCEIMDSVDKVVENENGENGFGSLLVGTGTSQPCFPDIFDEEVGSNIAFMKAKLAVNLKKHKILERIFNEYDKLTDEIEEEIQKVIDNIDRDLTGIRRYNPEYLPNYLIITEEDYENEEENC